MSTSSAFYKFECIISIDPVTVKLHCGYFEKYAKGDFPTEATLYKNYTDNRALDVMDTCRIKIMKKYTSRNPNPPF